MKISTILFALAAMIFLTGCASLTGFQDGRTLGEQKVELGISLNVSQSPDFIDGEDDDDGGLDDILVFPNFELTGKYGVTEKFDLGLRLNTNLNFSINGKYQLFGDQTSPAALAIGTEVGTFGIFYSLWNIQFPLYFSIHPEENFSWYLSPRYIFQFAGGNLGSSSNYLGGNTGLLFGSKHKIGIDLGYYRFNGGNFLFEDEFDANVFTIGVGGKFVFGGKEGDEEPEPVKKTRKRRK
ncbi:MAG: hypothetical protein IPN29_19490 [Saprospiraceae bacterium]|nr:hypothetical protein [Saprospiraceae bacterium]